MISYNNPGSLQILAQTVIVEYVSKLCVRFAQLDSTQHLHALQVCKHLQFKLHNMVPRTVANDLTNEIFKHLILCYKDIKDKIDDPSFQEKLKSLMKSVLSPRVTILYIVWDWMFVTEFIMEKLGSVEKLEVLKFKKSLYSDAVSERKCVQSAISHLHVLKYLQILCVTYCCNDALLEIACNSCEHLKMLDARHSRKVTDKSISYILKLRNLEELKLSGTSVSKYGYYHLKKVLVSEGCVKILKTLDFDCYSTLQLIHLQKFQNLSKVSLVTRGTSDLSVLKHLKNMKVLKLRDGDFIRVKGLLVAKGNHLLKLKLELDLNNAAVDLKFIAKYCPSLQSLKVFGNMQILDPEDDLVFPTITSLSLQSVNPFPMAYLVPRCKNLSVLTLCTNFELHDHILDRIFLKDTLSNLKELTIVSFNDYLSPEALSLITVNCVNLSSFTILTLSTYDMERECRLFPGVHLTCEWQQEKFEIYLRNRQIVF